MTRAEEIAAALERYAEQGTSGPDADEVCDEMARILRESRPDSAAPAVGSYLNMDCGGCGRRRVLWDGTCEKCGLENAAPAVGEDEALLAEMETLAYDPARWCEPSTRNVAVRCITRLRAALTDVARERERADTNLANAKEVQQKWCDESNRAIRLEDELDIARAALAAAVAEEREAWKATIREEAERHRLNNDHQRMDAVLWIIRARAGRNDE